jgi:hypothetical protein
VGRSARRDDPARVVGLASRAVTALRRKPGYGYRAMNLGPDDDRVPDGDRLDDLPGRRGASFRGQFVRSVLAASACAAVFKVSTLLLVPLLRPSGVAGAVSSLLLSVNMFVGYVGGRVAARAGLPYDDPRSPWFMAATVAMVGRIVELLVFRVRGALPIAHALPVPGPSDAAPAPHIVGFVIALLLIRFGYAMGMHAQARREGRVSDEDEAGLE